jgi:hypothetical protein
MLSHEVIKMTDEPLELPQFLRGRRPRLGVMLDGKARHAGGVPAIILVALEFTLAKGFDASGSDHTDTVAGLLQIQRQVLPVRAGRFHDRMPLGDPLTRQPRCQRVESGRSILEYFVPELLPMD